MSEPSPRPEGVRYSVGRPVDNSALNGLYAASWPRHRAFELAPVLERSLTWVTAHAGDRLIGFAYLAWNGAEHAFLLEPAVHPDWRRRGIGTRLVGLAVEAARGAGVEWVHVDYEPHLRNFYARCGFRPTEAGLIRLPRRRGQP